MNTSETSLGSAAACCDHDCACGALLEMTPRRWELLHRGLLLAWLTVGWNVVEVLSGLVVLWRLRAERSGRLSNEAAERRAVGLIALSFFVVAAYVTFESARDLVSGGHARPSTVG